MTMNEVLAKVKDAIAEYDMALQNRYAIKDKRERLTNILLNNAKALVKAAEYTQEIVENFARLTEEYERLSAEVEELKKKPEGKKAPKDKE